jgi:1-aminocyclopropane-1-carboxylate deaminase/D-cysteine desulfhydrase-like pyridoxal-dependent ACC family enzyme
MACAVCASGTTRTLAGQAEAVETLEIAVRVVRADRRHDACVAAEQVQRVRDVPRAAAEFATHRRHEEVTFSR